MSKHSATYSLADDKLRIYPAYRLDPDDYKRVKDAGFSWAPKQELFYATWGPHREDVALELAGDIDDEDMTPQERAIERAARFGTYSDHAGERSESARHAVDTLADGIPLGQPILVGHHSEQHARKDAERIQNGMRRVVDEMKRAAYWESRARASLHHAERRERPDVIARRIKTLEAERRKVERSRAETEKFLAAWQREPMTLELAKAIANYDHGIYRCFTLAEYPRTEHTYEGEMGLWSALDDDIITGEQARDIAIPVHQACIPHQERWLEHLDNRLAYERALLADKGGLVAEAKPVEVGGAIAHMDAWLEVTRLNRSGGVIVSASCNPHPRHTWRRREIIDLTEIKRHMTKAEYEAAGKPQWLSAHEQTPQPVYQPQPKPWKEYEQAAANVLAVSAPELFPTPAPIIGRMLDEIRPIFRDEPGDIFTILEPSAGTGAIVRAARSLYQNGEGNVYWCEINERMREALVKSLGYGYLADDFMTLGEEEHIERFDAVVMNPPFSAEIEHVRHAYSLTRPGGIVVSIMSEGPFFRQERKATEFRAWLDEIGGTSEPLPAGSFAPATGINTRLVVIRKSVPVAMQPEPEAETAPYTMLFDLASI